MSLLWWLEETAQLHGAMWAPWQVRTTHRKWRYQPNAKRRQKEYRLYPQNRLRN